MIQMTRNRYSREFKEQAVELVKLGKPVPDVARELGVGSGLLYRWVGKLAKPAQFGSEGVRVPHGRDEEAVADELRGLRRENTRLKMENDILKKAAVILGTNPPAGGVR